MTHIADALNQLQAAHDLGETPVHDTLDAALWRVRFTIRGLYDEADDPEDPGMAVRDILTDLVHFAEVSDVDIEHELSRAQEMAASEDREWGHSPAGVYIVPPPHNPAELDEHSNLL